MTKAKIILVGNTKGGVGKTTLAINIAVAKMLAGEKVWLIDGDRQGTAQTAIALRAENKNVQGLACASYHEGRILKQQVLLQREQYDTIVIDAGGRDSSALRAALGLADILVVPFKPRSFDVWALADISALIEDINEARENDGLPELKCYTLLNGADSGANSLDNKEAIEAIADYSLLKYLDTPIVDRKAFATLAGQGLSVLEGKANDRRTPLDKKAVAELRAFLDYLD